MLIPLLLYFLYFHTEKLAHIRDIWMTKIQHLRLMFAQIIMDQHRQETGSANVV